MSETHHIIPMKGLLYNAGALLVLTFLTVAVTWFSIPAPFNVLIAIGIACVKATLVALFFMSLYWDAKFNAFVFITSFVFFLLFALMTLLDFSSRDVPYGVY